MVLGCKVIRLTHINYIIVIQNLLANMIFSLQHLYFDFVEDV